MKTHLNILALLFVFTLLSCKKENSLSEYKYADKAIVLTCDNLNSKLYHEALYTFENDLLTFYGEKKENTSLIQAYSQFIRGAVSSRINYRDMVSPHTLTVFEALKKEDDLWLLNDTKSHLNYDSKIISCISNNIIDAGLKTTFNALLTTNSMSPKLFGAPLMSNYRTVINDKYLATYIAFDLFYAKLFDVDFTEVKAEKPKSKVDFNITE